MLAPQNMLSFSWPREEEERAKQLVRSGKTHWCQKKTFQELMPIERGTQKITVMKGQKKKQKVLRFNENKKGYCVFTTNRERTRGK